MQVLIFPVPQGSAAGPILYLCYASTMRKDIPDSISIYGFADDHGLRNDSTVNTDEEQQAIVNLEECVVAVKRWMDLNTQRLKMNCAKTEFILVGSKQQLGKTKADHINVNSISIKKSSCIKYLGALPDGNLRFKQQITSKFKTAIWNMLRLKYITECLTKDAAIVLALGMVMSHLDYANAILAN